MWQLGLARLAWVLGRDLQRPARAAGGGERLWGASPDTLGRLLRVGSEDLARVLAHRSRFDERVERERLGANGIVHIGHGTAGYPSRLAEIHDPPFGLFVSDGPAALDLAESAATIAVVGSRRPTSQGLRFACDLAHDLTARGALVVSGLALGIDASAHEGALAAGGATLAVLGNGVDVVHPRRNARLGTRIRSSGALISEYWPGTPPAPWRFPARNRIVAGLADAVVVVEAGIRSGALITADFAMELGRPVLAVPGPPGAAASVGCNQLLRAGAAMCEAADDVVAELPDRAWEGSAARSRPDLDGVDRLVHERLLREPLRVDELVASLGADAAGVAASLARLEIDGYVLRGQGQRYWAVALRGAA